jgi:hypothetical protein
MRVISESKELANCPLKVVVYERQLSASLGGSKQASVKSKS